MKRVVTAVIASLTLFWTLVLMAQTPQQNEFVPQAAAPKQPEIAAAPLLYVAYAFVWAALLVYVFMLWRRIGRVERELTDVRRKLKS